jgi:ABC-type cobalamin/Fe3+-siderophores transport system ATPase subunit
MLDATRITQAQEMLRLYLAGDYEDGLGRDLVVTIPDSDADLACSISDSIDDSLTIKAVTPVHRRDSLRDFNLGLPHYALSQHGASLCVDKVKLALREGRQIIDGLSFELQPGHVYVLTGENGSGKSLLLKAIAGKLPKAARVTQGRIAFGELRHKGREESLHLARSIIFVPQHCSRLLTTTNPWSVIEDLTTSKTVSLIEHSRRLLDAGILWKVRPVTEASVGQVRFVTHLLAAISAIVRPCVKWILADEPDAYLDSCYQQSLAELFTTVAAAGKGVLLTSHSRNLYPGASEVAIKPYIRAG